jgi:multiple sugar transport system permease protein
MSRKLQYALLAVLGLLWLVPLYLVLVNAVKPGIGFNPNTVWIPSGEFAFVDNVVQALDSSGFGRGVVSTALYSVASPALSVLVGAAAGFGIVCVRYGYNNGDNIEEACPDGVVDSLAELPTYI